MSDDKRSAPSDQAAVTSDQAAVTSDQAAVTSGDAGTSGGNPGPTPRLTLRSGETGHAVTDTVWSQVGGSETFEKIARAFYRGVREDEVLAPMYPQDDWEGATWRIQAFLEQYWGGPSAYQEQRGHPRLRMRHDAFPVTPDAKERWLKHMHTALDEAELPPMHDAAFRDYIERAALALVNRLE